jgi:hypothetical protein
LRLHPPEGRISLMPSSADPPAPQPDETPLGKSRREALAGTARMREVIRQGRALPPLPEGENPDWDLHERRLAELERIIRTGTGPADVARFDELEQEFHLDFDADVARAMALVQEEMVRFVDDFAVRVEEKKFELPGDDRDELEEMLAPYHDHFREKMLGELPIEKRRELEEARRRRAAGDPPAE